MKVSISVLILAFSSLFISAVPSLADEVVGAWDYAVDTPDGVYKGQMIFYKTDDEFTGKMVSQGGETALKDLKVDGNKVSFSLYVEGNLVKVKGAVEGDAFEGKVEVEYEFFTIKATRAVNDPIAGTWKYSADTPDGVYSGKFVFTKGEDGYSGKMITQGGESALKDVKVEGNNASFSVYTEGFSVKVKGTFEGKTFEGKAEVDYEFFPVKAEKVEQ